MQQVFNFYDQSGDGWLDFKEFANIFGQKTNPTESVDNSNVRNDPYIQEKQRQQMIKEQTRSDAPEALLQLFKDKLKSRGTRGMVGLQRIFKIMDDDESGTLTMREFNKACKDFKVGISEENVPALFQMFDANKDGTMSYDEFLYLVRGDMNQTRIDAVTKAY